MAITLETIVQEVRKLARENPKFIYNQQFKLPDTIDAGGCSYLAGMTEESYEYYQQQGNLPGDVTYEEAQQQGLIGQRCIVGQALSNLGVSDSFLKSYEGVGADYLVGSLTQRVIDVPKPSAQLWLAYVQGLQDKGYPWAEAVKIADEVYPIG